MTKTQTRGSERTCVFPSITKNIQTGKIGTLTSGFREATAAVRRNKVPLDAKKKKGKKNPGEKCVCVCVCSPKRRKGSENYSSSWSHLSLAKAAPARRPDIPPTTVPGGCVRPPARLSPSPQHPHARTHWTPPVRGAHPPTKSFYVAQRHMAFPCPWQRSRTAAVRGPRVNWKRWRQ